MSYTSLIYWITVASNVKLILGWFAIIFTVIAAISIIGKYIEKTSANEAFEIDAKLNHKWCIFTSIMALIVLLSWASLPSKKDALIILAAGSTLDYVTSDSTAREIPKEVFNYVKTELQTLTSELNLKKETIKTKETILNEAANLTPKQLIEKMKSDSNFAKVILE
jgi:hypothetical protein